MKERIDEKANVLLGAVVRRARRAARINQTTLAPKLGLDQSALSRVETGQQQLTALQWLTLCRTLRITSDIIWQIDNESRVQQEEARIAAKEAKLEAKFAAAKAKLRARA